MDIDGAIFEDGGAEQGAKKKHRSTKHETAYLAVSWISFKEEYWMRGEDSSDLCSWQAIAE